MKVKVLRPIAKIRDLDGNLHYNLKVGEIIELPDNQVEPLMFDGYVEPVENPALQSPNLAKGPSPIEQKTPTRDIQTDPKLSMWLEQHGFSRGPNGHAYSKIDKLETGAVVKLVIDFKDNEKGNRYGLRLNEETGGWKNDAAMRDHPSLLEFKAYRDKLYEKPQEIVENTTKGKREIPTEAGEGQQLLLQAEKEDEKQIIAELQGDFQAEVLRQYFYSFTDRTGRKIVGLSYRGVKQIALRQGHIELKDLEIREGENGITVIVKARHKLRDLEVYGVAWQPREFSTGSIDSFALQKAVSKAQRNALRFMIPETVVTEAYKAWEERREEWFK